MWDRLRRIVLDDEKRKNEQRFCSSFSGVVCVGAFGVLGDKNKTQKQTNTQEDVKETLALPPSPSSRGPPSSGARD